MPQLEKKKRQHDIITVNDDDDDVIWTSQPPKNPLVSQQVQQTRTGIPLFSVDTPSAHPGQINASSLVIPNLTSFNNSCYYHCAMNYYFLRLPTIRTYLEIAKAVYEKNPKMVTPTHTYAAILYILI
jgi:hypothetical protein